MGRNNDRGSSSSNNSRRVPKDTGRRVKKKPCALCKDRIEWVDYKDLGLLRKYMSDRGKIRSRRVTGNCAQHQRDIAQAIKVARELVLLPYTQRTTTERPGGRGGRGRDGGFGGGSSGPGRGRPRSDSEERGGLAASSGSMPIDTPAPSSGVGDAGALDGDAGADRDASSDSGAVVVATTEGEV